MIKDNGKIKLEDWIIFRVNGFLMHRCMPSFFLCVDIVGPPLLLSFG